MHSLTSPDQFHLAPEVMRQKGNASSLWSLGLTTNTPLLVTLRFFSEKKFQHFSNYAT